MILGVQHRVLETGAGEQSRQRFGGVDTRGPHQHRIAQLVQSLGLFDDGVVFLPSRFVDEILSVIARDRAIRGDHGDGETIDLVELVLFRFGRAGHAGQLFVHAEVILDRDGGECLRFALDLHAFLGFDGLMQPLTPAAARHGTSGELIHDEHLPFLHHVIDVLVVQRVRAQQLMDDVQPLAFRGVFAFDGIPLFEALGRAELVVLVQLSDGRGNVGQHEGVAIVRREPIQPLLGEMHRMSLLVQHEQQVILEVPELLLAGRQFPIREVIEFHALHQLLDALLLQRLHEPLVLGPTHLRLVQLQRCGRGVTALERALAVAGQRVHEIGLSPHQTHHRRVELRVLPVAFVSHRTGDDQRCARFIDQDGVDFIDHGEDVLPLHALVEGRNHVVAQVIEAKLVVRAVGDVGAIHFPTLPRAGLGVVQATHREPQPPIQMSHPLRVAPREIAVHSDKMRTAPRQRIQIQRQRGHQRLAFTCGHFGDPTEVQLNTTNQLHFVGDHVPCEIMAGHHHVGALQAATRLAHGGEGLGQNFIEEFRDGGAQFGFCAAASIQPVQLGVDALAFREVGGRALDGLEFVDARFDRTRAIRQHRAKLDCLALQFGVGELGQSFFDRHDIVDDRLDALALPLVTRSEYSANNLVQHADL